MSARQKERARLHLITAQQERKVAAYLMDLAKPIKFNTISETMLSLKLNRHNINTMISLLGIIMQSLVILCHSSVVTGNHINLHQMISSSTISTPQQQQKPVIFAENQSKVAVATNQKSLPISNDPLHLSDRDKNLAPDQAITTTENADLSTGSITEISSATHLEPLQTNHPNDLSTSQNLSLEDMSELDDNSLVAKNRKGKIRRHVGDFHDSRDWWRKLTPGKNVDSESRRAPHSDTGKKDSKGLSHGAGHNELQPPPAKSKPVAKAPKRSVYVEQPLNQNPLLTIRYQLAAIKGHEKILVTRSMRQLEQLDLKLIDSYRFCLKKKAPLFAGMLYRTRDFVTKMAKEAKHERKVLEAMTRQVQGVLRQKMTNKTLVREYRRLMATSTELPVMLRPERLENSSQENKSSTKNDNNPSPLDTEDQLEPPVAEAGLLGKTRSQTGKKVLPPTKTPGSGKVYDDIPFGKGKSSNTRKGKPTKYVVSVNEVNLKKELNKIQALIDRINASCHELDAVADDITYLLKLSSLVDKKGNLFNVKISKLDKYFNQPESDVSANLTPGQKHARRILKSPVKVFLDKYSKFANLEVMPNQINHNSTSDASLITTTTNASVENASNVSINPNNSTSLDMPDMKPIFEPVNLAYADPVDQNIGFDSVVAESEW